MSSDSMIRLTKLRELMKDRNIDAYVVPSEDAHASEYLAPCDARRAYITSFTGSAGCAVITKDEARCWTDGRYWIQAEKQLGEGWTLMKSGLPETPTWGQWLKTDLPSSSRVGIDPTTIPQAESTSLSTSLSANLTNSTLVPITENLVDIIWRGEDSQPSRPSNEIFHLADQFTGENVGSKISRLRDKLKKIGSPGMVISSLDEIAWLFNLRGSDIPYNPVFFAYAILTRDDCTLFASPNSLTDKVRQYLHNNGIALLDYCQIWNSLGSWQKRLIIERSQPQNTKQEAVVDVDMDGEEPASKRVKTDGQSDKEKEEKIIKSDKVLIGMKTSWAIAKSIGEDNVEVRRSIIEEFKSKKNATEIEGFRQSHIRDGVALAKYFSWLEEQLKMDMKLNEYDAALKLEEFRKENKWFMGLSFETISSTGSNAAIIHYSPLKENSKIIDKNKLYLCDSGGQYLDGTTDVTRTFYFGSDDELSNLEEEKRAFTRVLQGHISLDSIIFPQGTTGYILDILARKFLWLDGLDYRHSTSHGLGSFLNVHEGPQGIGQRISYNEIPLIEGMIISNEPGYYSQGKFGIRIEGVDIIVRAETRNNFGNKGWLSMERITMCPIQTSLLQQDLLSPFEKSWLNDYHAEVLDKIGPLLKDDERALRWLKKNADLYKVIRYYQRTMHMHIHI